MVSSRGGFATTALLAIGAAGVTFACLPGAWPSPLSSGPIAPTADVQPLTAAVRSVAEACARGDLGAFEAATTRSHRDRLERNLAAVDGVLDGKTLRALGEEQARTDSWSLPRLAGEVRGTRALVVVARPDGAGASLLSFVWNGHTMLFDGTTHLPTVRDAAAARAALDRAFAAR